MIETLRLSRSDESLGYAKGQLSCLVGGEVLSCFGACSGRISDCELPSMQNYLGSTQPQAVGHAEEPAWQLQGQRDQT